MTRKEKVTRITMILLFFFFFTLFTGRCLCSDLCNTEACDPTFGPEIRFPFRLKDRSPVRCGYPGFDLYCNSQNMTILDLPESGEFVVDHIDYRAQALFINDPDSCLATRILNFSSSGTPFRGAYKRNYTFYNCSSEDRDFRFPNFLRLDCLSGRNYSVLAVSSQAAIEIPATCRLFASVFVPLQWTMSQFYWSPVNLAADLELYWRVPVCGVCESDGGICGYKGGSGLEIGCFRTSKSGLPRSAKYGIIVGAGIPGLVCIIGLSCYACGMIRTFNLRRRVDSILPTAISAQRPAVRSTIGLDRPTIESYPTTVLGESRRLPKISDGTCPICLSDYQPKETLRSLPECDHYFHAQCIDEWLKRNGTCPVCRNSPESPAGTPFSSASVSIASSLSSPSSSGTLELDRR